MAIIKSYTDLEQSKVLADILPLKSADMDYIPICNLEGEYSINVNIWNNDHLIEEGWIPCWSLAALLNVIPKGNYKDFSLNYGGFQVDKYIDEWFCSYQQTEPVIMLETRSDNPIDACVEMVVELHESNLL